MDGVVGVGAGHTPPEPVEPLPPAVAPVLPLEPLDELPLALVTPVPLEPDAFVELLVEPDALLAEVLPELLDAAEPAPPVADEPEPVVVVAAPELLLAPCGFDPLQPARARAAVDAIASA